MDHAASRWSFVRLEPSSEQIDGTGARTDTVENELFNLAHTGAPLGCPHEQTVGATWR